MRAVGHETRGFTAPNRLRATDTFLGLAYSGALRAAGGLYVDLGYGTTPVTTVETWRRLRRLAPGLRVVGVERDPERVAAGQAMVEHAGASAGCPGGLEVRLGGFDLALRPGEVARFVRAMNVFRQYEEDEVSAGLGLVAAHMEPGGVLIEGTCDPPGRLMVFTIYRRTRIAVQPGRAPAVDSLLLEESLVFAPRLRDGFSPRQLQAVLPKRFIHHAEPGGSVDAFFAAWESAWARARPVHPTARGRFAHAARSLAASASTGGVLVDARPAFARRGFLVLRAVDRQYGSGFGLLRN